MALSEPDKLCIGNTHYKRMKRLPNRALSGALQRGPYGQQNMPFLELFTAQTKRLSSSYVFLDIPICI